MIEQDTIRLLRECDAGVKMGVSSIDDVLKYVKSENLTGPYNTDYTICSLNYFGVEGSSMYRINGTDKYMMIMDEYGQGTFFAQMTDDFVNFRQFQRSSMEIDHLKPRHGSVVSISEEEYKTLVDAYGIQKIPE